MREKLLVFTFLILFSLTGCGQVLTPERNFNWYSAGLQNIENKPDTIIIFEQVRRNNLEIINADEAIKKLLSNLSGNKQNIIYFPKGKYYFTEPVILNSNTVLRGESTDSTIFLFKLKNENSLINIVGKQTDIVSNVLTNIYKDDTTFNIENASNFYAGDYIKIIEDDKDLITSSWALYHTGQIVKIDSVNKNKIFLASAVRRNYDSSKALRIIKLMPVKNSGIENINLERLDTTTSQTSNINFTYAANCWVKCIQSKNCNFAHIAVSFSTNIEISGNYIHHAFNYGNGGKAYGVLVHYTSGECLVQKNIFNNLRHSILLQGGANGNVFAFNYSINPYWTDTYLPSNAAGDIVLHGNYPYANLFEGNVVQNIVVDNSHGKNGPNNTFFRNRAELYGIYVTSSKSDGQNFIANEITNENKNLGNYVLAGYNHFELANNYKGAIIQKNISIPNSLFLKEIPEYYKIRNSWPPIGYPNNLKENTIEVAENFNKNIFTVCNLKTIDALPKNQGSKDSVSTNLRESLYRKPLKVFPNPAQSFIHLNIDENIDYQISGIKILTLTGSEISYHYQSKNINIEALKPGFYFLKVQLKNGEFETVKFVKS